MKSFYLKGLNSYRAFAAFVVVVGHIEIFKQKHNFNNLLHLSFFKYTGQHISVILFFALSGFLITTLLLHEKQNKGFINVKQFYLRRIFRVWPLYYLILLLSYLLLSYSPSLRTTLLCVTIFPNIAHAIGIGWVASPPVWSIGVEEQFYIGWPLVVKHVNKLLIILVVLFIILTLLPHVLTPLLLKLNVPIHTVTNISAIFYGTKFNCMIVGGIVAVLYNKKHLLIQLLNYTTGIAYGFVILPFVLWFSGYHINYFTDELYAILFSISIVNISTNTNIVNIDFKPINYLGKISYGIYMYHWIVLELLFKLSFFQTEHHSSFNAVLYGAVFGITICIAALSYQFIEQPLLSWKERLN